MREVVVVGFYQHRGEAREPEIKERIASGIGDSVMTVIKHLALNFLEAWTSGQMMLYEAVVL